MVEKLTDNLNDNLEMKNRIEKIRDIHKIQGTDGNWDHNDYMTGIYNGFEIALAILENRKEILKGRLCNNEIEEP